MNELCYILGMEGDMDKKIKLSGRELDVMNVLWEAERPLVAREIADFDVDLNINTVRMMLKGLLSKNYIKVAELYAAVRF